MSRRPILAALILTCSFSARAQSRNIHEDIDPYTQLHTLFLEVPTRTCPGDPRPGEHDPVVHILFSARQRPDGAIDYLLTAELDHGQSLNLRKKSTMDTLADGVPGLLITPVGSTTTTAYSGNHSYLHETIPFSVLPADLQTLARTELFQFRINGPRQSVQRCIEGRRFHDLPEFLAAATDYLPHPTPQP